jgi:hypothetical protein
VRRSTLHALRRAAELFRANRSADALAVVEPLVLAADTHELRAIEHWLADHIEDFIGDRPAKKDR